MSLVETRPTPTSAGERPVARWSGVRTLVALATLVVVTVVAGLAVSGGSTATGRAAGLADAGRLTTWLLPVSRSMFDLAAIGTVGTLTALAWLVPPGHPAASRRLRRAVAWWAMAWAVATTVHLLASVSQVVGVPLGSLPGRSDLLWYGVDLPQGRGLLLVVVVAVSLALWIGTVRSRLGLRAWTVIVPASMAPLLATGHAATASNHFLATETLLVHVLAVTLWTGGLLALVVHVRPFREVLPVAVAGFSRLALVCLLLVGVSGLVGAWTRLGLTPSVWGSTYGVLLLLKTGALGLVAGIGWAHRRQTIPALVAGRPRAFVRFATVELGLMAVTVGLAVVLARTSPPITASLRAVPLHATAYPTVDPTQGPLTPVTAVTELRQDALTLTAVLVGAGLFLAWARTRIWAMSSAGRRARLVAGLVVTLWALVGAPAAYATLLLSAQVTQLLVLGLLAPPLLASGLPPETREAVVDRLRSGPLRPLLRPAHAVPVLLVVLALALQTSVLELSLRGELSHLALSLAPLLAGLLVVLSLEPGPGQEPVRAPAALLVLAAVLAWYGVRMWSTGTPAAGGWYENVSLWWTDPAADQRIAGLVVLAAAVGTAVAWVVAFSLDPPISACCAPPSGRAACVTDAQRTTSTTHAPVPCQHTHLEALATPEIGGSRLRPPEPARPARPGRRPRPSGARS